MANKMDMELRHGLIIVSIRGSMIKEKEMFLAPFLLLMEVFIKVDFMRMRFKAKEF